MRIRFYVMRSGEQWQVLREAKRQGLHDSLSSAMVSALFMASLDGERGGGGSELFVEDAAGRLQLERTFCLEDRVAAQFAGTRASAQMAMGTSCRDGEPKTPAERRLASICMSDQVAVERWRPT